MVYLNILIRLMLACLSVGIPKNVGRVLQPASVSILSLPTELLSWSTPTGVRGCLKTFNPAMIVGFYTLGGHSKKTPPFAGRICTFRGDRIAS